MMQKPNKIPDKNPFRIPENYFDEVNRKIVSATSGNEQELKKTGLYRKVRPYFLVAASVAGFILLSYTAVKLLTRDSVNSPVSEVIYGEYSESYLNDFDILSLEENAASLVLTEEIPDLEKTVIIDYLLLENIDINEIYEQL